MRGATAREDKRQNPECQALAKQVGSGAMEEEGWVGVRRTDAAQG